MIVKFNKKYAIPSIQTTIFPLTVDFYVRIVKFTCVLKPGAQMQFTVA